MIGCSTSTPSPTDSPGPARTADNVWQQASLRGVSFRALGQEPGWLLEITDGTGILLVTEYGANSITYPFTEPQVDTETRQTLFTLKDNTIIEIREEPCSDTMSGERFTTRVTVTMSENKLTGCGRKLH